MHEEANPHHHPNYVKIWGILLVLLVISILGPTLGWLAVTLITAFGIAVVKALMVAAYFMHLNTEKKIIWYLMGAGLLFMFLLFCGMAADIMKGEGNNWRHLPAATAKPDAHPHE